MESETISIVDLPRLPEEPPVPISINDLLQSVEVMQKKEADDKLLLESIGNMSHEELKQKLLAWATKGFPNIYEIYQISIIVPEKCSDGQVRNLADYILFCSGKPMYEHVQKLSEKVNGISLAFVNMQSYIGIVVSKAS